MESEAIWGWNHEVSKENSKWERGKGQISKVLQMLSLCMEKGVKSLCNSENCLCRIEKAKF